MTTNERVRRLYCACCGGDAGRWQQWWNRDTGYGVCARCVDWIRARDPDEDIEHLYGHEGVHWGQPQD